MVNIGWLGVGADGRGGGRDDPTRLDARHVPIDSSNTQELVSQHSHSACMTSRHCVAQCATRPTPNSCGQASELLLNQLTTAGLTAEQRCHRPERRDSRCDGRPGDGHLRRGRGIWLTTGRTRPCLPHHAAGVELRCETQQRNLVAARFNSADKAFYLLRSCHDIIEVSVPTCNRPTSFAAHDSVQVSLSGLIWGETAAAVAAGRRVYPFLILHFPPSVSVTTRRTTRRRLVTAHAENVLW